MTISCAQAQGYLARLCGHGRRETDALGRRTSRAARGSARAARFSLSLPFKPREAELDRELIEPVHDLPVKGDAVFLSIPLRLAFQQARVEHARVARGRPSCSQRAQHRVHRVFEVVEAR